MLFRLGFIRFLQPVICQFIIWGSGFFIRAKNLSEFVRRIPADLLGFPEIPSVLTPKREKNSPLTLWRNRTNRMPRENIISGMSECFSIGASDRGSFVKILPWVFRSSSSARRLKFIRPMKLNVCCDWWNRNIRRCWAIIV
jgi:hypothetical protein